MCISCIILDFCFLKNTAYFNHGFTYHFYHKKDNHHNTYLGYKTFFLFSIIYAIQEILCILIRDNYRASDIFK